MGTTKDKVHLSGYALDKLGWAKKGFVWIKNKNTVTYDGTHWLLNGFPIKYVSELP